MAVEKFPVGARRTNPRTGKLEEKVKAGYWKLVPKGGPSGGGIPPSQLQSRSKAFGQITQMNTAYPLYLKGFNESYGEVKPPEFFLNQMTGGGWVCLVSRTSITYSRYCKTQHSHEINL